MAPCPNEIAPHDISLHWLLVFFGAAAVCRFASSRAAWSVRGQGQFGWWCRQGLRLAPECCCGLHRRSQPDPKEDQTEKCLAKKHPKRLSRPPGPGSLPGWWEGTSGRGPGPGCHFWLPTYPGLRILALKILKVCLRLFMGDCLRLMVPTASCRRAKSAKLVTLRRPSQQVLLSCS